jgi:hypothetical protein
MKLRYRGLKLLLKWADCLFYSDDLLARNQTFRRLVY